MTLEQTQPLAPLACPSLGWGGGGVGSGGPTLQASDAGAPPVCLPTGRSHHLHPEAMPQGTLSGARSMLPTL